MSNDLISRQAAIDICLQYCPDDDGTCSRNGDDLRNMLDEIEALPTVDAVRVVRCGECKWWHEECMRPHPIKEEWYCAGGERRVRDLPAADVVPVVRCKDCKWLGIGAEGDGTKLMICIKKHHDTTEEDYCSEGVNREDDPSD